MSREYVHCPHAQSSMTPCVVRDGALAVTDPPGPVCVGCGRDPHKLRMDLARRYAAIETTGKPTFNRQRDADRLRDEVAAYIEWKGTQL